MWATLERSCVEVGSVYFASTDHNPGDKVEDDRIIAAGGKVHTTPSKHKVIIDSEAYTNLAVSRITEDLTKIWRNLIEMAYYSVSKVSCRVKFRLCQLEIHARTLLW